MKKYFLIFNILLILQAYNSSKAQNYIGIGANYYMPQSDLKLNNLSSTGYIVQFESRRFCKYWYGLRVDYVSFNKKDNNEINKLDTTYFTNSFSLSPTFRYNFIGNDCEKYDFIPYGQAMLNISSIGHLDEKNRLGLGYGVGGGVAMSFNFVGQCMMLDLNALYSNPNSILRAENRKNVSSINVGLILSVRL